MDREAPAQAVSVPRAEARGARRAIARRVTRRSTGRGQQLTANPPRAEAHRTGTARVSSLSALCDGVAALGAGVGAASRHDLSSQSM